MAGNYTVKQGDHVSKLAKAFGFSDYHAIWDHPENADLKQKRQNPNILLPGDSLYIPDVERREESAGTDQQHLYTMRRSKLQLCLILEDLYERPIANAACILVLGSDQRDVTTDPDGRIEQQISPEVHEATLVIHDRQTPFHDINLSILIGDMDPADQISGQAARLRNLGYFTGDTAQKGDKDFQSAVEEFQCDHGLTVDGICGPVTQSRLKQVHGC
jgi:N-acetylmuramoyl-L-alanine amidase